MSRTFNRFIIGLTLFGSFFHFIAMGQGRIVRSINEDWRFIKKDINWETSTEFSTRWESVDLPHTWNTHDPFDERPGYYRGIGWYAYQLNITKPTTPKNYILHFEAVNQEAEVMLNGKTVGKHLGGYTAFSIDITKHVRFGEPNILLVKVDNSHNEAIPPLKGDFNFYGGIYRDVWLYEVDRTHFNFSEFGDKGLFISTPQVSKEKGLITLKANIKAHTNQSIVIANKLFSPSGNLVFEDKQERNLDQGENEASLILPTVQQPELWHPDSPHLYRLVTEIRDINGKILDNQTNQVGFRWFEFDAEKGFFINGEHLKLMGTNRHQDYPGLGNALSNDRHVSDVQLIKDMGSTFFRTAHYPQDPAVLDQADRLGLVVTMEIPLDHDITDSPEFLDNSKRMMQEMIRQNFNHPSVAVWAYMNEMLLGRNWDRDQAIIQKIVSQAKELEALTRAEDPSRFTMIPNHGALDLYVKSGLTEIPMIVGWNLYYGWYEKDLNGAGAFLDAFREKVPNKPVLITEYGAGADPRIRSLNPERFDFSIEWQNIFHQQNLVEFMKRDFLAGAAIWNIADFGSEGRQDAEPKINSKGIVAKDRTPKDAFYLNQAWQSKKPVLKIAGMDWNKRMLHAQQTFPILVFSNQTKVKLWLNGKSQGKKTTEDHIATWNVPLQNGINTLRAKAGSLEETTQIEVELISAGNINWAEGVHVNCGANFFFSPENEPVIWLSDEAYSTGTFGYNGGNEFRPRDRGIGSDMDVYGTNFDPVYQTNRVAPNAYQFDVPAGKYEVTLLWAEVDRKFENAGNERVFNVSINGQTYFKQLNIAATYGFRRAISKSLAIETEGGLAIDFEAIENQPFISAIEIRKLF